MDDLISTCIDGNSTSQRIIVTLNNHHPLFAEHFPNNPTLPGALVISMVISFARQFFEKQKIIAYELSQIERVSFIRRIQPTRNYYFQCSYKFENECNVMRLMFVVIDCENSKIEYARGVITYKKKDIKNESVSCCDGRQSRNW